MKKIILLLATACSISVTTQAQNVVFSNQQNASKTIFASNEFIYGKDDLGGKTVKEFFRLPDNSKFPYPFLYYVVEVYKGDELLGQNNWNVALVKPADVKQTSLNFDVLPDPAKATTVLSGTEMFDAGKASAPLY